MRCATDSHSAAILRNSEALFFVAMKDSNGQSVNAHLIGRLPLRCEGNGPSDWILKWTQ